MCKIYNNYEFSRNWNMKQEKIKIISPRECRNWQYDDRAGFEYGDIYSLGLDIKSNGQIEPVVVRNYSDKGIKYEVIAGSRRWKACLEMELPLLARIVELEDEDAALYQIKENDKYPVSDYSKGLNFSQLLEAQITTIERIAQMQNCSKQKVYDFLAFSNVPVKIWNAVIDMSKVSSRSAKTIYALSNKGEQYINALIDIAEEIRKGAGAKKIEALVTNIVSGELPEIESRKEILNKKGDIIGYWVKNGIAFNNNVTIDQSKLEEAIVGVLD